MPEWQKNIRIQSDGTGPDTVITLSDGTELKGVRRATIHVGAKEVTTVELEIVMPVVDVHADTEVIDFVCPICKGAQAHRCFSHTLPKED